MPFINFFVIENVFSILINYKKDKNKTKNATSISLTINFCKSFYFPFKRSNISHTIHTYIAWPMSNLKFYDMKVKVIVLINFMHLNKLTSSFFLRYESSNDIYLFSRIYLIIKCYTFIIITKC